VLKQIKNLFGIGKKAPPDYGIQTFTYYIPAPPERKSGYREKQFDRTFQSLIKKGFEVLSVNTQAHAGVGHSGMWVLFTLRALTAEAALIDLDDEESLEVPATDAPSETVDGLYYIKGQDSWPE
jgi:hypothetical protein